MTTKAEKMAYDAGRRLPSFDFGEDATEEQRTLGEHHCPFERGDPQRDAWLRGVRDGLGDTKERASLAKRLDEEIGGSDDVR